MKKVIWLFVILFLTTCEKNIYEADPRLFNDAMHGNIVGKVLQNTSNAIVVVSQVNPIDSATINTIDGSFEIPQLPIGNYDLSVKADNYRIYKLANVMVQGAGNTYIGQIDLSTVPDLISSHYPADKEEIVYNRNFYRLTISMTFTQPMDRKSVEEAFSTSPPTEGIFHWGQYSKAPSDYYYTDETENWGYSRGATITTFSKITSFSYQVAQKDCFTDTVYTVNLATTAKDTAGNFLRFPLTYSFSTVQSSTTQNAIITSPSNGDINVGLISNSGIQISFPRNMDKISTENALKITPSTDNIFIWPGNNLLTIYTGGALLADTTYTIEIDSTAADLDGIKLGNPFSFSFSTAPVGITSSFPRNGELFVSPSSSVDIYFNTYVLKSSVIESFSISPHINGTLNWYNNSSTNLRFEHGSSFAYNTKYTVTIGTGVKDIFGTYMKEPYVFSFIVRPE